MGFAGREELTDGSGQTQNLVLSFDGSEAFHLANKIVVTAIWDSLFPAIWIPGKPN